MSIDEYGKRTQRPTERRRREARARGDVARSTTLVSSLVLFASAVAVWWLFPMLVSELAGLVKMSITTASIQSHDDSVVSAPMLKAMQSVGGTLLSLFLVTASSAAASNLVQTGFLWTPGAIIPKLDRLDPTHHIGRVFSIRSLIEFASSLIRLMVLIGVLVLFVRARLSTAGPLVDGDPPAMLKAVTAIVGELAIVLSLSLVAMAAIDYGYCYWRYEQSLMMTVEEVRREQREENGDPRLKGRRRELAGSLRDQLSEANPVGPI